MPNFNYTALATLPAFLVSKGAITLYVVTILAAIVVLAISLMIKETARATAPNANNTLQNTYVAPAPVSNEPAPAEEVTDRFCMLSEIERRKDGYRRAGYDEGVTLESFCENLRN